MGRAIVLAILLFASTTSAQPVGNIVDTFTGEVIVAPFEVILKMQEKRCAEERGQWTVRQLNAEVQAVACIWIVPVLPPIQEPPTQDKPYETPEPELDRG